MASGKNRITAGKPIIKDRYCRVHNQAIKKSTIGAKDPIDHANRPRQQTEPWVGKDLVLEILPNGGHEDARIAKGRKDTNCHSDQAAPGTIDSGRRTPLGFAARRHAAVQVARRALPHGIPERHQFPARRASSLRATMEQL